MMDLQEVLLVQIVRKYGTQDYTPIASAMQQHPLLTSGEGVKIKWDKDSCRSEFNLIQERELTHGTMEMSPESTTLIDEIWKPMYHRYLQHLKSAIKVDEEQFKSLQRANSAPGVGEPVSSFEVPSSTQETTNEERSSRSRTADAVAESTQMVESEKTDAEAQRNDFQVENVSKRATSDHSNDRDANETVQKPSAESHEDHTIAKKREQEADTGSETSNVPKETKDIADDDSVTNGFEAGSESRAQDYPTEIENGAMETSHKSLGETLEADLVDGTKAARMEDQELSENSKDEEMTDAEANSPAALDTAVDEIAVAFNVNEQTNATDNQAGPPSMTLRKSRTRSSTMNTVTSTDIVAKDDSEAENVIKRGSARNGRRNTTRESETTRSSRVGSPADEPESAAAQKRFQSTILPVLANIATHRYASVFANPVSNREAPNYSKVVKSPVDIKTIRAQVKSGEILTVAAFHRSVLLMLSNAVMYNPEDSEVATMAQDLFVHVEEAIAMFTAAEDLGEVNEDRTPKRRRRNNI